GLLLPGFSRCRGSRCLGLLAAGISEAQLNLGGNTGIAVAQGVGLGIQMRILAGGVVADRAFLGLCTSGEHGQRGGCGQWFQRAAGREIGVCRHDQVPWKARGPRAFFILRISSTLGDGMTPAWWILPLAAAAGLVCASFAQAYVGLIEQGAPLDAVTCRRALGQALSHDGMRALRSGPAALCVSVLALTALPLSHRLTPQGVAAAGACS